MIITIRPVATALLFLLVSSNTFAQSAPTSLFACLNGNGNLYGVTPTGKLGDGCAAGDLAVSLGSAGQVNASNGLVGKITNGVVDIGVAPGLAIPLSCPPGQTPIADGQGAWICTLPNQTDDLNPGAKVWVVPQWSLQHLTRIQTVIVWFLSSTREFSNYGVDTANFLNPGAQQGRVICYSMTLLGGFIPTLTEEHEVSPGSRGQCDTLGDERGDTAGRGDLDNVRWLVLVSDVPMSRTNAD
jgi:hypothetical protein